MTNVSNQLGTEFTHAFQPIVDISNSKIYSYEILLRGLNDEPPEAVFNAIAKGTKIVFDQHSREQAFEMIANYPSGKQFQFNISPNALSLSNFKYIDQTLASAEKYNLSPSQLIFELTEEEAIKDLAGLKLAAERIKAAGAFVAIDDFGAGHSGLSLLAEIKPHIIKVDRALIHNINQSEHKMAIIGAINSACIKLGIDVIAEGVESKEEFEALKRMGIKLFQGFYIAKPQTASYPKVDFSKLV